MTALAEQARLAAVADYMDVRPQAWTDLVSLCRLAALVCNVPKAAANLIDNSSQHQVDSVGLDPGICAREDSMCAVTVSGGCDVVVTDASEDERFRANPWVDGRLANVRFYASTLLATPNGHLVGTLCVFDEEPHTLEPHRYEALQQLAKQVVDVLELQVRTRRLSETLTELERSHEQLAAFAGQISHDLKTPLTATIGFSELLSELPAVTGDDTASAYVGRCMSSGRRMLTMIDDLLDFARVGGELRHESVALDDLVPAVLDDLGARPDGATVRWDGPDLHGDPVQLRALVQNLVGNALNYRSPDREPAVSVTTRVTATGVELRVADNGPGIAPEKRATAMAPLRRLTSEVPGSGLGLATCQRIVTVHGGSLRLDDTPGGGLTVVVALPG